MKKKRFYNNKKRNSKWTEKETGRKISFADKYIDAGSGSDKFDFKRPKPKKKRAAKEKTAKLFKNIAIVIACFLIISVGYSAMDLYIDRNAMPETEENTGESVSFSNVNLMLKGMSVQSISLDNSVMLDSVIKSAEDEAYSSVTFDLKRDDGTIGYNSKLATIRAYGAISSPAAQLEKSVAKLNQADIIPIGRISCYKDNIVALSDLDSAIKSGKSVYKDANGNAYLNPNNSTTYNYIKSIIEETKAMGINVFLLDNTKLPGDISGDYNDGFAALAKKLYAEFGQDIKFIEAIDVTINDDSISDEPVTDENGNDITADSAELTNSTSVVMSTVKGNKNAIGYVSLGSLSSDVKAVKLDGVAPSTATVKDGSYKLQRPFKIAYIDTKLTDIDKDFISFITSKQGEAIISKEGYISAEATQDYKKSGKKGTITIAGSTSVAPVMNVLADEYKKLNPDVKIEIQESGSSAGIESAIQGAVEIAMSSRELKDDESKTLKSQTIALDGIAVIVNSSNSLDTLTSKQVKNIFEGNVSTWEEVIK